MTETVNIPIVGEIKDGKVKFFCPRCKKPKKTRVSGNIVTELCGDCMAEIEQGLKSNK